MISQSAIKILQKRFGKPQQIVSTHMDELLKIPNCTNDKTQSLRLVYDTSIPGPYQRQDLFDGWHSSPRARYATLSVDEESSRGIHSPTILPPDVWIATVSIYITVGAVLDHHLDRNKKRDADLVELIKKSMYVDDFLSSQRLEFINKEED